MIARDLDRQQLVRDFIGMLGENPNREGLKDTPARMVKAWDFWTSGYDLDPGSVLKTFEDGAQGYDELVFQGNIPLYSHCEHHLAPFFGVAHIGYVPKGKIVGLSKLSRLVDVFAHRLQVQERLTCEISEAMMKHLAPAGVGVVLRCRHLCMESRGVQKAGTITYTSSLLGVFREDQAARTEFLSFVERADGRSQ